MGFTLDMEVGHGTLTIDMDMVIRYCQCPEKKSQP